MAEVIVLDEKTARQLKLGQELCQRFVGRNAQRKAQSARLRAAIATILDGSPSMSAKQVLTLLGELDPQVLKRSQLPGLRAVQWHLKHLRK